MMKAPTATATHTTTVTAMNKLSPRLPELLSPAGSPEALRAAVASGADAVYFGASGFNARMNAKNFTAEDMRDSIAFCHDRGVRVYLTLNTLVYDRELSDFFATAEEAYLSGADALIVADLGGAAALRRHLPDMPLHASTQMSAHNSEAARELAALGFSRVVMARELSRESIVTFTSRSPIETELFVHGALCVCHSGQCLFSSMVGGRSGNRGECAQPCRLPYAGGYHMSLKDLSLARYIPEIIESGTASLKIEGRMKPPEYVSAVTRVWRALLDEGRGASQKEMEYLADIFSRQGFTDGYFTSHIDHKMLGIRSERDKRRTPSTPPKYPPVRALSPITPYTERKIPEKKPEPFRPKLKNTPLKSAYMRRADQYTEEAAGYFDLAFIPLYAYKTAKRRPSGVALPPVITDAELPEVRAMLAEAAALGATDALVGNLGHISLAREAGLSIHGDFRLNICNNGSASVAEELGFVDYIPSPELTLPRLRDLGGARHPMIYGRIPLMVTEKCIGRECGSCDACRHGKNRLTDRIGKSFPILREWKHRSLVVNSLPTYMGDRAELLRKYYIDRATFAMFTVESPEEVNAVVKALKSGSPIRGEVRRISK